MFWAFLCFQIIWEYRWRLVRSCIPVEIYLLSSFVSILVLLLLTLSSSLAFLWLNIYILKTYLRNLCALSILCLFNTNWFIFIFFSCGLRHNIGCSKLLLKQFHLFHKILIFFFQDLYIGVALLFQLGISTIVSTRNKLERLRKTIQNYISDWVTECASAQFLRHVKQDFF